MDADNRFNQTMPFSVKTIAPPWEKQQNTVDANYPRNKLSIQLEQLTFENFFEHFVDGIADGKRMRYLIDRDPRGINYARLMRWIKKDPERNARFEEAQEIGTELLAEEILEISDAVDSSEDVQRSTCRISSRRWVAERRNKQKYGEVKQTTSVASIHVTVSREAAMNDTVTIEGTLG